MSNPKKWEPSVFITLSDLVDLRTRSREYAVVTIRREDLGLLLDVYAAKVNPKPTSKGVRS